MMEKERKCIHRGFQRYIWKFLEFRESHEDLTTSVDINRSGRQRESLSGAETSAHENDAYERAFVSSFIDSARS